MDSNEKRGKKINRFIVGLIIMFAGIATLYINESRVIHKHVRYNEEISRIVTVPNDKILPENDGKLIYLHGTAQTMDELSDEQFNISVKAIHLKRGVETYQWIEKQSDEGIENTEYIYEKQWKSGLTSHRGFKDTLGHTNPIKFRYSSKWEVAENVYIGPYELDRVFINSLNREEDLNLEGIVQDSANIKVKKNTIYIGKGSLLEPEIGDVRLLYSYVKPQEISIIGKQKGERIVTYNKPLKPKINMLEYGNVSYEQMFNNEMKINNTLLYIFRLIGFILVFTGILLFYAQLKVAIGKTIVFKRVFYGSSIKVAFLFSIFIGALVYTSVWIIYNTLTGAVSALIALIITIYLFFVQKNRNTV